MAAVEWALVDRQPVGGDRANNINRVAIDRDESNAFPLFTILPGWSCHAIESRDLRNHMHHHQIVCLAKPVRMSDDDNLAARRQQLMTFAPFQHEGQQSIC